MYVIRTKGFETKDKIKISKEKWLKSSIKYDDILVVGDIIEQMCEKTYAWISLKKSS